MAPITLITGGARSGKSRFAEQRVLKMSGQPVYIATAEGLDAEMQLRIQRHQQARGKSWLTVEEPLDLAGALAATDGKGPRLVDCLTLWLSNVMLHKRDWCTTVNAVAETARSQTSPVVFVTNEVGSGIVPSNELARDFRDASGFMNQMIGAIADEVFLVVCGQSLQIKG